MATLSQSALYAYNALTRRWVLTYPRALSKSSQSSRSLAKKDLVLTSWNVDAFSPRPTMRASCILNHILNQWRLPDIIFFQEVKRDVYDSLLRDNRVRDYFFATEAEDQTAFQNVPFSTVILLSTNILSGLATRVELPSKYGRDGLFIDIKAAEKEIRLTNVHLDSLSDTLYYRTQQIKILAHNTHKSKYAQGIIAGDFNAITSRDHQLIDENGLKDQWLNLNGKDVNGDTWRNSHGDAGRLDKITMIGLEANKVEILRPGLIRAPSPGQDDEEVPWSDHSGLTCSFSF